MQHYKNLIHNHLHLVMCVHISYHLSTVFLTSAEVKNWHILKHDYIMEIYDNDLKS